MKKEQKEKIALFRFGVISPLIGLRTLQKGEREKIIEKVIESQWDIPYSGRSYVARSTILSWLKNYEDSGQKIESLYPKSREDKGLARSMDKDTQQALLNLKKENRSVSVPVIIKLARQRKLLPNDFCASIQSIYRLFKRHNLDTPEVVGNFCKFEAELPNDLWQSDCMHGPDVIYNGKRRKTFLYAIIDDHSRVIPHAEFYFQENLDNYIDCLQKALAKRGLPRKLYLDNGPAFRAHRLKYSTASLGIALIHATAYRPEGKGKIERFFKTVRMCFLSTLMTGLDLQGLNEEFTCWINKEYHVSTHSATGHPPLQRYLSCLHLLRPAPKNLNDVFRVKCKRKVLKDRTVSLNGKLFEAPCGLVGKTITLLFHKNEPEKVEVFYQDKFFGHLTALDINVNYRVGRKKKSSGSNEQGLENREGKPPVSGKLFNGGNEHK